jgi:hypothetical protein
MGRVLAGIVAALVLAGAAVMGALLAGVLLALALLGSLAFMARIWWLRRRLRRGQALPESGPAGQRPPIDAEFRVIEAESRAVPRSPGADD